MPNSALQNTLNLAWRHHQRGDLGHAEQLYRQVLRTMPEQPDALHHLGVIAHQRGDHAQAVAMMQRAAQHQPGNAHLQNNLGEAHRACGNLEASAQCFKRVIDADDSLAAAHNNLGLVWAQTGDIQQALGCFRRAVALDADDFEVQANLADALAQCGFVTDAISQYQSALLLAPDCAWLVNRLAHAYAMAEDADSALTCHRRAVGLAPDELVFAEDLAQALFEAGLFAEARTCYQRLVGLKPGDGAVAANYAKALNRLWEYDLAVTAYQDALALARDDIELSNDLASCLIDAERFEEATQVLNTIIESDPNNARAHLNLGSMYLKSWQFARAESMARAAIRLEPAVNQAHLLLGFALFHQDRLEEAADAFLRPARELRALGNSAVAEHRVFKTFTWTKLLNDAEQIAHLIEQHKLPSEKAVLVDQCRRLLDKTPKAEGDNFHFDLPSTQPLASHFNRIIYDAPAPQLPEGVLDPGLDLDFITSQYHANAPGIVYFDDFLTPSALHGLQQFCQQATIWFELKFLDEVGTGPGDGFCCPLVLQLAKQLRDAFPGILGEHLFDTCWSYKYFHTEVDRHVHADHGAVNINFWITPDTANLDAERGGLTVWNKMVPPDYFRLSDDQKHTAQMRIIEKSDATELYVPYRCNRMMMFNSNLLHKTERPRFKNNYLDRRVSVTFLYGKPKW